MDFGQLSTELDLEQLPSQAVKTLRILFELEVRPAKLSNDCLLLWKALALGLLKCKDLPEVLIAMKKNGANYFDSMNFVLKSDELAYVLDNFMPGGPTLQSILTTRQREIVACLADGKSNKEIASDLGITRGTVKAHLRNIFGKTGISDRQTLAHMVLIARAQPLTA